ncbi:MAG: hypothetical protein QXJ74_00740 [Nitrososphaera sp.]|uniref:hypothetical protein n=1 Tax=Nitrososphaera sp. TaxID=1971748 RepID=UPI0018462FD3|nr:hypothetical protein [Nitrososphaera sp.]NWG37493.1 hypothetical protein [Nitrososphaera sp.]
MIGPKLVIVHLLVFTMLTSFILPASASASQEWQTHYAVNGLVNSGPPDPYQIFKVHYRAINGTVEQFSMKNVEYPHDFQASVTGNGTLEIMFPKNYPNVNADAPEADIAEPIFLSNGQEIAASYFDSDCFRMFSIPFSGSQVIDIAWPDFLTNEPYRGSDVPESCMAETLVQDVVRTKDGIIPPLHQMKAGVRAEEVACGDEFELVARPDGRPYCATSTSAEILKQRWNIK